MSFEELRRHSSSLRSSAPRSSPAQRYQSSCCTLTLAEADPGVSGPPPTPPSDPSTPIAESDLADAMTSGSRPGLGSSVTGPHLLI